MGTGAITSYIDVAQLVLYAFWIFFAGLIYYLRARGQARGLSAGIATARPRVDVTGLPADAAAQDLPARARRHGHGAERQALAAAAEGQARRTAGPARRWSPTGNPMLDGVGPGAYADRADVPDLTFEGHAEDRAAARGAATSTCRAQGPRSARHARSSAPTARSAAPCATCGSTAPRALFRYLEVEPSPAATRRVLLPINFARIDAATASRCASILGHQFAARAGARAAPTR